MIRQRHYRVAVSGHHQPHSRSTCPPSSPNHRYEGLVPSTRDCRSVLVVLARSAHTCRRNGLPSGSTAISNCRNSPTKQPSTATIPRASSASSRIQSGPSSITFAAQSPARAVSSSAPLASAGSSESCADVSGSSWRSAKRSSRARSNASASNRVRPSLGLVSGRISVAIRWSGGSPAPSSARPRSSSNTQVRTSWPDQPIVPGSATGPGRASVIVQRRPPLQTIISLGQSDA